METPLFVFAHGAGAPSSHPWMQRWIRRLATIGTVAAFDYAYIKNLSKRPDPLPKLVATHRQALHQARQGHNGPTVLIGKALGHGSDATWHWKKRSLRNLSRLPIVRRR